VTIKAILERYPDGQIFKVCSYIQVNLPVFVFASLVSPASEQE